MSDDTPPPPPPPPARPDVDKVFKRFHEDGGGRPRPETVVESD